MEGLTSLVGQLAALAGVGALVAVVINVGKAAGIVRDGQAPTFALGLNILALAGLFALKVFAPSADIAGLDATAGQIAAAASTLFGLFVQLQGSRWGYGLIRGVPVVGKSHSG